MTKELMDKYLSHYFIIDDKWAHLNWKTYKLNNSAYYRKVSNIRRTLIGNKIVDNSDVVGASLVGAAPTTSSLST